MSVGLCVFISSSFAVFSRYAIGMSQAWFLPFTWSHFPGNPNAGAHAGREARLTFKTACATAEGRSECFGSTRLFRGPSQLDSLVPLRHGDELQMLGAGLDWSLQYGPGCHLSSFSFLICKMGRTQQHTPWDKLGDLNYFIVKYLRQGDTGTWRGKKKKGWRVKCSWQFKAIIRNCQKRRKTLLQQQV